MVGGQLPTPGCLLSFPAAVPPVTGYCGQTGGNRTGPVPVTT